MNSSQVLVPNMLQEKSMGYCKNFFIEHDNKGIIAHFNPKNLPPATYTVK